MQFTSYTDFRDAVRVLIEGDETSGAIELSTLDLLIAQGEYIVYHGGEEFSGLRASTMEADLSVAVVSNAAALPSDLLELKEVYFSGERPLDIVSLDRLRTYEADASGGGRSRWCAQDGDTIRFWPVASSTALGTYWKLPADMKSGSWATHMTVNRYPLLFIYAALSESAPFIGDSANLPIWSSKFKGLLESAKRHERQRALGGHLRVRTR